MFLTNQYQNDFTCYCIDVESNVNDEFTSIIVNYLSQKTKVNGLVFFFLLKNFISI